MSLCILKKYFFKMFLRYLIQSTVKYFPLNLDFLIVSIHCVCLKTSSHCSNYFQNDCQLCTLEVHIKKKTHLFFLSVFPALLNVGCCHLLTLSFAKSLCNDYVTSFDQEQTITCQQIFKSCFNNYVYFKIGHL